MAYCSSYYLYQRYEKRGDQDWIPSYPNVYSIDGEGAKPLRARQMYDTDCGWIPDTEPIYRWTEIAPTSDPNSYWCDNCPLTNIKMSAHYSDSTTYNVDCNSSTTLSQTEVRGHSTAYSSMTSAEIGDCVRSIGGFAFLNCSGLTSIDIPNSVTSIGNGAFELCTSLTSIDIPSGVTTIGQSAFEYCRSLTSIEIPSGVTSIGWGTFNYCISLPSIDIPNSVTNISDFAFEHCRSLTSIEIPSGVTSIGRYALSGCTNLTSITVNATTPPTLGEYAFDNTNNCPIYVPCESVEAYKSASGWSSYASRIQGIEPCYSYSGQYLTLEAIDSTAFSYLKVSGGTILYSLDNGATWTENYSTYNDHQHITKTPVIPAGSKVMFKGVGGADNNILPITSSGDNNYSARFKVYGNVMSMVHGDNFSGKTNLSGMCFSHMFTKCSGLTDAGNLILPALNLSERRQDSDAYGCYALMFNQCTSLTTAPELPATGLTSGCYTQMFYGCTSLNYIKCLATDISSTICTSRWVDGVASSGTFVKNASAIWPSGISGIPDNWTVQNA